MSSDFTWPILGCGAGLRAEHYQTILSEKPRMPWFEAISENFMDSGGRPIRILEQIRQHYPIALHGVSLSIGSTDPLNPTYLDRLKKLVDRIEPFIVSDHLCWSGVDTEHLHDLLPLPFTEEAVDHAAERIQRVQDRLGRKILIENVSTYVTFKRSAMTEWEFLTQVARRAGCGILLDLNNIYVNSKNHGFDPDRYLREIPEELVGQFHLAGHTDMGAFLFDTHSSSVVDPVWELYRKSLSRFGQVSTLVEWDASIPEFSRLQEEVLKAERIYAMFGPERYPKKPAHFSPKQYPEATKSGPSELLRAQRVLKDLIRPAASSRPADEADQLLNPQGGVPGSERMEVYTGGYTARILEALTETYEAVQHLMGSDAFAEMAAGYAARYPSHDYNLSGAARFLPEYLQDSVFSRKLPFLPDLAALERLIAESFHAGEGPVFDPTVLSTIPADDWGMLRLTLQPSVRVFASTWPVLELWSARKTPLKQISVDLVDRPQNILICRSGTDVRCAEIGPAEYRALHALMSGLSLEEMCESLEEGESQGLPQWMASWSQLQIISSLSTGSDTA